jgi:hypothetical protein
MAPSSIFSGIFTSPWKFHANSASLWQCHSNGGLLDGLEALLKQICLKEI